MGILSWIILGGIAGWIATVVMDKDQSYGILGNIALGIIGGLFGGFVFSLFGGAGVTGFNFGSFLVALIGSVVVLWIFGAVKKSTGSHNQP